MDVFVIEREENIKRKLKTFMKNLQFEDSNLFIFDVHKTALTREGEINKSVYNTIKKLLDNNFQVIFLSYVGKITGKIERIEKTANQLNSKTLYREIPKFFIKKRIKQVFMKDLSQLLIKKIEMTLIDDNSRNISDVNQLKNKKFKSFQFEDKVSYKDLV
mgnify:CR=1 FL=1